MPCSLALALTGDRKGRAVIDQAARPPGCLPEYPDLICNAGRLVYQGLHFNFTRPPGDLARVRDCQLCMARIRDNKQDAVFEWYCHSGGVALSPDSPGQPESSPGAAGGK